jgi:hypothetical protein
MVTPLSHVFFRAFFSFVFGLATFYFMTWAILSSTVPDNEAMIRFGGCTLLSGLGSIYFILVYRKTDVYLPKNQSLLFYSCMAVLSLLIGTLQFFHIESYHWIEDRMRLPPQILNSVIYLVFFVFALIRISEARFLPSLTKSRQSDELVK